MNVPTSTARGKPAPHPHARKSDLTEQERANLAALAKRREILAASEVNRRTHSIIEQARELAERIETYLAEFDGNEAKELLGEGAPKESQRWGIWTFHDPRHQIDQFASSLRDFLMLVGSDLPPLPVTQTEKVEEVEQPDTDKDEERSAA